MVKVDEPLNKKNVTKWLVGWLTKHMSATMPPTLKTERPRSGV